MARFHSPFYPWIQQIAPEKNYKMFILLCNVRCSWQNGFISASITISVGEDDREVSLATADPVHMDSFQLVEKMYGIFEEM